MQTFLMMYAACCAALLTVAFFIAAIEKIVDVVRDWWMER